MRLGKIKLLYLIFYFVLFSSKIQILSAPVINLENLEPSYENIENQKTKMAKILF